MSEVDVIQDTDVAVIAEDDAASIVVTLDSETEIIQTLEQGPPGPQGEQGDTGLTGADGNTVLYGAVDPTVTVGAAGNFYINTTTHFLFGPKAGTWPAGTSLIGPQGAQGVQGAPGVDGNTVLYGAGVPAAGLGVNGNFYIDTTAHSIYGPKAAGAWPAGTSLIGPQGPQGAQGPQGVPGAGAPGTAPPLMDAAAVVGTSLLFSREDHVHPSDANARAVRFDSAQSLTAAQQVQARQNVFAAPFDALAYNGMQINGSAEVSQEFGSTGTTLVTSATSFRPCDGWNVWAKQSVGAMSILVVRSQFASLPGFGNGILINANNSNFTNATSGDYLFYAHGIEGYRTIRLGWGTAGAMPLSYGFWFYSTVSGVIFVRLGNSAGDRIYHQEHTVTGASWNWLTATIPGDTAGTWLKDNNAGLYLAINVAGKETTPAIPGVWSGTSKFQTTNSTNLMGTSGNQTWVTGLIVVPGIEVPSAARSPYIMRPYDQELQTCQRYWQKLYINDSIWLGDGNGYGTSFPFDPMRSTPSINSSGLSISGGSSPGGYPQFSVNANSFMMVRAINVAATIQTITGSVILDARL